MLFRSRSYGGAGNDIFNIDAVSNYVYGEDGDDSFNIISGTKHTIDGGGGTNNVTGNKDGNTLVNVIGANAFSEAFAAHETKTLTIDGKEYIITNGARAQSLNYKITTSGEIEFSSTIQAAISIKGQVDKSHNVRLSATAITFYGGDMSDIIRSSAGGCVIYAGGGDDIISGVSVDTIYAQSGNNIINAGNYGRVYGGTGKDTITLASYNQVIDASGGCEIIANGHNNTIAAIGSNNTITKKGTNNFFSGFGDEDNAKSIFLSAGETKTVNINGINYTMKNSYTNEQAVLYSLNPVIGEISFSAQNSITIEGQNDVSHNVALYGWCNFYGGEKDDVITQYGWSQHIYGQGGNDKITINGNGVAHGGDGNDEIILNSGAAYGDEGDDIITVNIANGGTINGGLGNDTYNINAKVTNLSDTGGDNIYNVNANDINISGGQIGRAHV